MTTICIDCRYIKAMPSGISEVVGALIDHLPAMAPDWHFLFLRHRSVKRPLSDAPNVSEATIFAETNSLASMWCLPRMVDLSRVDLFHSPANILPRGLSMPCVTTIHDIMWLTDPELCKDGLIGRVQRAFFQHGLEHALQNSDTILTVSDATNKAIADYRPDVAARTRTTLSGVNSRFAQRQVDPRTLGDIGLSGNAYILTIGQSAPYKNHERAIRAFAIAFSNQPDVDLVLVHRRGSNAGLKRLARQLGIGSRVQFLSDVPNDALISLYNGAMALLHPSLHEGFGMPLAEAMACGCPIVTSNVSAMPEVTGDAAILVDPTDISAIAGALRRISTEPELTAGMKHAGLMRAKQLDWNDFAEKNLAAYRNVLTR